MSELVEPAGHRGMGSLLMMDGDLPRRPSGGPYQPAYWVDEDGKAMALVTDGEGHPLGHHEEGDDIPDRLEDWGFSLLPAEVADAARAWVAEHEAPGPPQ